MRTSYRSACAWQYMFALMTFKRSHQYAWSDSRAHYLPYKLCCNGVRVPVYVCVCRKEAVPRWEGECVYSDTLTHWRIVSAHSSKLVSNAIAPVKRRNLRLKTARVTQTHSKQDLENLTHLKWELAALRGKIREKLEKLPAGKRWASFLNF